MQSCRILYTGIALVCLGESSCVTKDGLSGQTIFRILYIGIALVCIGESFSIFFFLYNLFLSLRVL